MRRNNVGTFFTVYGNPISIGLPGESDLTLFAKGGKTYFVEIKTAKGRQSQKQKNFERIVSELGFEYIVMRSIDDAKRFVKKIGGEAQ